MCVFFLGGGTRGRASASMQAQNRECSLLANLTLSHYPLVFIFFFMMFSGNTCVVFNLSNSSDKVQL